MRLNITNICVRLTEIKKGQLLIIQRKQDKRKLIVKCKSITNGNEVILSNKNDYFNFDMYLKGESWVLRVWVLPVDVEITDVTNNKSEFPR